MSLRMFHLFFITMSVVMAVFAGAWATAQYRATGDPALLGGAFCSFAGAAGLAVYGTMFQRKTRNL
jgi:hypothetical protein